MNSRKFTLLIVGIIAAFQIVQIGCVSETEVPVDNDGASNTGEEADTEGQLAPGYVHPQGFSMGH